MSSSTVLNTQLFHSGGLSMQYATWGSGKNVLLTFHGFSRSHRDFVSFTQNLDSDFTIYAFDLFFHKSASIGKRKADKDPLRPAELKTYFEEFLKFINTDKVWLMGYSLGGRISLKLAEIMPDKIGGLYLFAPDGLVVNSWYAILSFNSPGRALFRFLIKHSGFFLKILDFIHKIGIISEKRKAFVLANIKTTEMQWQVYHVWTFLRKIDPKMHVLGAALLTSRESAGMANEITVDLFMGKYDRIIPIKNSERLKKAFPKLKLHIMECGHVMLTPHIAKEIDEKGLMQMPEKSHPTRQENTSY